MQSFSGPFKSKGPGKNIGSNLEWLFAALAVSVLLSGYEAYIENAASSELFPLSPATSSSCAEAQAHQSTESSMENQRAATEQPDLTMSTVHLRGAIASTGISQSAMFDAVAKRPGIISAIDLSGARSSPSNRVNLNIA
jgi:hypothetical protein